MDEHSKPVGAHDFLISGGEMGELIRSKDWSKTPLGPVEGWPQSLKTSVTLILSSQHPMWVGWGPENTFLYNDAYLPVLGSAKHPWALGRPAAEVWAEIWNICGPLSDRVYQQGEATIADDVRLFMRRGDFLEETFYSFSYSPIRDESGEVRGLFCPSTDVTGKNLNTRRLGTLSELAAKALVEKSTVAACATAAEILSRNPDDIPFALLYLSDMEGEEAVLEQTIGPTQGVSPVAPRSIPLESKTPAAVPWPIAEVLRTSQPKVVSVKHLELPRGPAEQPLAEAIVLPVSARGHERPVGALVAGVNPTRKLDAEYHTFFTLVAAQVATAVANARAYEEERTRAETLSAIDRAKTVFFSNVSHEFRTPLTLILGPTEELLSGTLGATSEIQRAHLMTLRHNAGRLQKLVNTLLDYARIDAGRIEASYEPVDIGLLTRDLASTFCSAVHRAGLLYMVNCPSIGEPVYIDRDMWEKIVLNLLSNALKFTFKGVIEVTLKPVSGGIAFAVRDTGVGIADDQLPHLSDRFYRVPGSRGRTQEGSGIGLALVQELVKLHGGSFEVESEVDSGTTFTIFIPTGTSHLPKERLSAPRALSSTALGAAPFVEEALRWLPDSDQVESLSLPVSSSTFADTPHSVSPSSERILVADDNLEMRNYLKRLLETHWHVELVADGAKALDAAQTQRPDLVLTDVMMPELGGFELLRKLREDARTATIPVILLSARAGEESYIEGMNAGADDYIVKPFGARELIARVKALLEITRVRRDSERRVTNILEGITDGFQVIDADWRLTYMNSEAKRTLSEHGIDPEWAIGKHFWDAVFPQAVENLIAIELHRAMAERVPVTVEFYYPPWDRWYFNRVYPLPEGGLANYFQDITERKEAEKATARLAAIVESSADAIVSKDLNGVITSWNRGAERLFGYTAQEAIGHSVSMLIPPERLDEEPSILERIRRGERIEHYETVRRRKNGTRVDISLAISPIVDAHGRVIGASKIARDITERKEAERKLSESEERFRTMADSSPIMIWMTDSAGHASFLNRTYREYCNIAADETAAFNWAGIVHPDDRKAYVTAFQTALQEPQIFHQRVRLLRRDGRWRWFESRANPMLDNAGRVIGFVGSSLDITEIYESQQALEELSRRKDEFLATLSHELRNPLAPIRNAVEILKSVGPGEAKFEWCRDLIDQQVHYMARLMEDLLDLSRITRNILELRKQPIDLSTVIRDAIETSRPQIETGRHRLTVDLPADSILLDGDPTRLMQLFANLLNNAAKYMEPNGHIHLTARLMPPAAAGGAQEVVVSVKDTGIGIAPELLPHLFDMFFQAESGKERRFGGLGIGLTLARSIVELHGGSIEVFSEGQDKGSEFRVRLPLPEGIGEEERANISVVNDGSPHKLSRRVLVVDDNKNHVESIAMLLKILGCEVRTAHGGPSALQALNDFVPEVALIDIGLPGIDGFELARRIRNMKEFRNIVLIAQTGWGSDEDREQSRQAGFDYHLIKPLDFQVLEMILTTSATSDVARALL